MQGRPRATHLPLREAGAAGTLQPPHAGQRVAAVLLALLIPFLFEAANQAGYMIQSLASTAPQQQQQAAISGRPGTPTLCPPQDAGAIQSRADLRVEAAGAVVGRAPRVALDLGKQKGRSVHVEEGVADVVVAHRPHELHCSQRVPVDVQKTIVLENKRMRFELVTLIRWE